MTLFQSLLLGIVQGLTEFIPVSSTAHLILVPWLLNWKLDETAVFVFDVLLQWGTLAAVIVYFWKDLLNIARAVVVGLVQRKPFESFEARLGWLIVVATIPAVVIGLLLKDFVEGLHRNPVIVALILLVAAGLLIVSEWLGKRTRGLDQLTWVDALVVGGSQALALLPGVSRSAATICGGLVRNLERPAAARFSFLMSIPVLFGAGLVALKDLFDIPNFTTYLPPLALGFVAAAIVGFASIHWLLGYLAKRPMHVFAWYRIAAGVIFLAVALLRLPG
jgi:undecaprenyl-diphosphatase